MQKTNQYQFNLMENTDPFSPAPLNENMEKVEGALGELAREVAEKSQWVTGTYVGSGAKGRDITLGFRPRLVVLAGWWNGTYRALSFITPETGVSLAVDSMTNTVVTITDTGFHLADASHNVSGKLEFYAALR